MIGKKALVLKGSPMVGDEGLNGMVVDISLFGNMLLVEFPTLPEGKEAYYHDGIGELTVLGVRRAEKKSRWYWQHEVNTED